jgi:hypothetical protein
MVITRWIVHCSFCGYLTEPNYPAQWAPTSASAYRFDHKREALGAVTHYSPTVQERLAVEPMRIEKTDAVFD